MLSEQMQRRNGLERSNNLDWGHLMVSPHEQVNVVGHDLDFFELPSVGDAGLSEDVAQINLHLPRQHLVPELGAPDEMVPKFIDCV